MGKIKVTIDSSITDKEIFAVIAGLNGASFSANLLNDQHNKITKQNRSLDFGIDVVCTKEMEDKGLEVVLQAVLRCPVLCSSIDFFHGAYLIEQVLGKDKIREIALPSKRALAQVCGILIGGEATSLVDLSRVKTKPIDREYGLLCLLEDHCDFYQQLANELDIPFDKVSVTDFAHMHYVTQINLIRKAKLVIGDVGLQTYIAACLGIPCIEYFSSEEDLDILSKWSSKKYIPVMANAHCYVTIERIKSLWAYWLTNEKIADAVVADGL